VSAARVALAATLVCLGCGGDARERPGPVVPIGFPFKLAPGQHTAIEGTELAVGFDGVIEDARCPADVVCVWEGTARLDAWLQEGGGRREIVLQTSPSRFETDRFTIEVRALEPFPHSNVPIDPRGYVVTLAVLPR
jgi:hypothetical protein